MQITAVSEQPAARHHNQEDEGQGKLCMSCLMHCCCLDGAHRCKFLVRMQAALMTDRHCGLVAVSQVCIGLLACAAKAVCSVYADKACQRVTVTCATTAHPFRNSLLFSIVDHRLHTYTCLEKFNWLAATLGDIGEVAETEVQELAKPDVQAARSDTQDDQVCPWLHSVCLSGCCTRLNHPPTAQFLYA